MENPERLPKAQLALVIIAAVIAGLSCFPPISTLYDFEQYDQAIGILPLLGLAFTAVLIGFHFARRTKQPVALGILAAAFASEWASIYNLPFNLRYPESISGLANLVFIIAFLLLLAGFTVAPFLMRRSRLTYLSTYSICILVFALGQVWTYFFFAGIRE